jgi:hypothetical protein
MKNILLVSFIVFGTAGTLCAGEGHNHEAAVESAPRGGTLRNAGDYKAEIVINGDQLKLYVYDKKLKPIQMDKAEITGDVQFPKEKSKPITFKKVGESYEVTIKGISKVHRYDMHINLEVAGKKVVADFGIDNI